jgi:RNA polymerase sigma factor for flagellar operon FliA
MTSRTSARRPRGRRTQRRSWADGERFNRLWGQYVRQRDLPTRNALIEAYVPIVKREAYKVAAALSFAIPAQELESAGTLGLIESIDNFDPAQGFKFVTFCTPRVRGAILDELRAWDWTPRATRSKLNKMNRATQRLEDRLGRTPHEEELAAEMDLSVKEIRRLLASQSRTVVSLDHCWYESEGSGEDPPMALLEDKRGTDPMGHLQKKEMTDLIRKMLSETERLVVTLYYYEQLSLREIGHVLGVTESRICQIRSEIVKRLRKRFA